MVFRFVAVALGALALSIDATSTRPYDGNGTTTTVCADHCWVTTTVISDCPVPTAVTLWSTKTIPGQLGTITLPASTVTVTAYPSGGPNSSSSALISKPWTETHSAVTAYITTTVYTLSVTTETDLEL